MAGSVQRQRSQVTTGASGAAGAGASAASDRGIPESAAAGTGVAGNAPGPWRRRCWSSSRRLGPTPAVAAVLVREDAGQALGLVAVEPGVHGVGVTGSEEAVVGHRMRSPTFGNLQ